MSAARSLAAITLAILLAGCGAGPTTTTNRLAPKDQEAADLRRAYDAGLLSPDEYREQRSRLGL